MSTTPSSSILGERTFYQLCAILKMSQQLIPSDPDRRPIEKAFRKAALKTHPDKPGGNEREFRRVNEAYNRLIAHVTTLEAIELEHELSQVSVVIEISKQAANGWADRLRLTYGRPRTTNIRNPIFEGPAKQFKGRGGATGPITLVLYEDPEDGVPKIHVRCDNYMAWVQEQNLPLHLHVQKDKTIRFDQWRIMSMAEFAFCKMRRGQSARHDWKDEAERAKQRRREEEEAKMREEEAVRKREEEERRRREEEEERIRKEAELERRRKVAMEKIKPWWTKHIGKCRDFSMSETTPPPEDHVFPKVFNLTRNCYTDRGKSVPPGKGNDDYFVATDSGPKWDSHSEEHNGAIQGGKKGEGQRSDQQLKNQVPQVFVSEGVGNTTAAEEQVSHVRQSAPSCCDTPDSQMDDDEDDYEHVCPGKIERDSKLSRKAASGRRGGIRKKSGDDVNARKLKQQFQTTAAGHHHNKAASPPPPPLARTPSPRWKKRAEGIFYKANPEEEEKEYVADDDPTSFYGYYHNAYYRHGY